MRHAPSTLSALPLLLLGVACHLDDPVIGSDELAEEVQVRACDGTAGVVSYLGDEDSQVFESGTVTLEREVTVLPFEYRAGREGSMYLTQKDFGAIYQLLEAAEFRLDDAIQRKALESMVFCPGCPEGQDGCDVFVDEHIGGMSYPLAALDGAACGGFGSDHTVQPAASNDCCSWSHTLVSASKYTQTWNVSIECEARAAVHSAAGFVGCTECIDCAKPGKDPAIEPGKNPDDTRPER